MKIRMDFKKIAAYLRVVPDSRIGKQVLSLLPKNRFLKVTVVVCALAVVYWGIIASDRYVSEAHVVIKKMDLTSMASQVPDLSSMITGGSSNRTEQMMLRDHLLSVDMLKTLDAKLNLRAHYSDWSHDPISAMPFEDISFEWFHKYYQSRVSVELDENSGVLIIKAQGFDPKTAHAICSMLVEEGENAMNEMARRMALDQVSFLQREAEKIGERAIRARQGMLDFQNKKRLLSPQQTAEYLAGMINRLEAQLSELKTKRGAMLGYLSSTAPAIVDLNMQISAVENQIKLEGDRLASPGGGTLNRTVEEYQRLQLIAELAQDMYKSALLSLEKGRIEAMRSVSKVAILQFPTVPEYADEPRRFYNIAVFIIVMLMLAGIVQLLGAIIKDHKD